MKTFFVYLKNRDLITLYDMQRFEIAEFPRSDRDGKFVFYNEDGTDAHVFIRFSQVALIISRSENNSEPNIQLHLKDREIPFDIKATSYKIESSEFVNFFDSSGNYMEDIYLAFSEVIAIVPERSSQSQSE